MSPTAQASLDETALTDVSSPEKREIGVPPADLGTDALDATGPQAAMHIAVVSRNRLAQQASVVRRGLIAVALRFFTIQAGYAPLLALKDIATTPQRPIPFRGCYRAPGPRRTRPPT